MMLMIMSAAMIGGDASGVYYSLLFIQQNIFTFVLCACMMRANVAIDAMCSTWVGVALYPNDLERETECGMWCECGSRSNGTLHVSVSVIACQPKRVCGLMTTIAIWPELHHNTYSKFDAILNIWFIRTVVRCRKRLIYIYLSAIWDVEFAWAIVALESEIFYCSESSTLSINTINTNGIRWLLVGCLNFSY